MKILWLCPFFPFPPNSGIRIREFSLIKELSQWHEIFLFSLLFKDEEQNFITNMLPYCQKVIAIRPENNHQTRLDGKRNLLNVLLGLLIKRPENFYGKPSENVISNLKKLYGDTKYDIMVVDSLFMSNYLWDVLPAHGTLSILVEHNIETTIQKQQWLKSSGRLSQIRKWLYYSSFAGFERMACRNKFDRIITVSEKDAGELKSFIPEFDNKRMTTISNGVDTKHLVLSKSQPDPYTLIYNGALTYEANFDAIQFFLEAIFPILIKNKPEMRLYITGSTEGVDLNKLKITKQVVLTGYLEDVHTKIQRCSVCIVPLTWGGGSRLKILEAMALGTPVVSSNKGVEGLDVLHGRDVLIANDPETFSKYILALLEDRELRERIIQGARKTVEQNYDWEQIGLRFHQYLMQEYHYKSAGFE